MNNVIMSYLLHITTIQGHLFKKIFEILNNIINNCKIIIYDKQIEISENDKTNKLHIKLIIKGNKLELFEHDPIYTKDCPLNLIVNIQDIHGYTKWIKNNETLSFIIEKSNPSVLIIIKNHSYKKESSHYFIKLKTEIHGAQSYSSSGIESNFLKYTKLEYDYQYIFSTNLFYQLIKDITILTKKTANIIMVGNSNNTYLEFLGTFGPIVKDTSLTEQSVSKKTQQSVKKETLGVGIHKFKYILNNPEQNTSTTVESDECCKKLNVGTSSLYSSNENCDSNDKIVNFRSVFNIKLLLTIIKATNLNKVLELLLNDNAPLTILYKIGDIGELRFILLNETL